MEKKFNFEFPVADYKGLLDKLASTPDRLEGLLEGLVAEDLVAAPRQGWSIQENAGHLLSLEELFIGRLDDYDSGARELRAADMTNQKTDEARHNGGDIAAILNGFRTVREDYVARLRSMPPAYFATVAWHPRLEKPMRVVDQLQFQLAHDEHHLERIEELKRS